MMACAACAAGWVRLELDGAECHPNPRDPGGSWMPCPAMMADPGPWGARVAEIVAEYPYKTREEEDAALGE